ncbi:hypothetical protein ACKKBG_A30815 [Auxenochlorella protothecoides x Auxenochlorella symbiontica]
MLNAVMNGKEYARLKPGGLSRAVADMRSRWAGMEAPQASPQPRSTPSSRPRTPASSLRNENACTPIHSSSRALDIHCCDVDDGLDELRQLMEASCLRDSPETTTFLGTSPPVRSGASNPLIHDVKWGACPDFQLIDLPCGMSSWRNIHTHSSNSPDGPWAVQHSASPSPTVL